MGGLAKRRRPVSVAATTVAPLLDEAFIDDTGSGPTNVLSTVGGVSYSVNRPSKSASNPIWPSLSTTAPDWGVGFPSAVRAQGITRLYSAGFDQAGSYLTVTTATTTDGVTLSRPNRNIVSYAGNTNNCLVAPVPSTTTVNIFGHVHYEPTLPATPYVMVARDHATGDVGGGTRVSTMQCRVYTSANGVDFTQVKTVYSGVTSKEAMAIWRRPDLRWVIYYQDAQTADINDYSGVRRQIGMTLSDTSSLTGAWTDQGVIITSPDKDNQKYYCGAWVDGELVYVPVGYYDGSAPPANGTFNGNDNRIWTVALYVGRATSGTSLRVVDSSWLPTTGVYGEWDGGEIVGANQAVRVDNTWHYYFGGDTNTHHQSAADSRLMGLSTIGYGRIGQVSGTGEVTLATVTASAAATVTINTTGGVTAALLDGGGTPITGYTDADCETIPSSYAHTIKWAGVSRTPATVRLRLTLSAGTVYHVTIREA